MRQSQEQLEGGQQRKKGQGFLSRVPTFPNRSRSSSLASSTKSLSISQHPGPNQAPLDRFEYFTNLPLELQAYVLTFLPARTLHKTMGRTNRYYRDLIESHTRRRILTLMSPCAWDARSTADHYPAYFQRRPANVLVFEAQRPIDTLTTKHTLHFSHFSRTEAQGDKGGSSTLAHFSFVPIERQDVRSHSTDSSLTMDSNDPLSPTMAAAPRSQNQQEFATASAYPSSTLQAPIPVVHVNDQDRLVQRSVTSSVNSPPLLASRSDSTQFTDVSSPMDWRETSNYSARLVPDENAGRAQGRGYEGFNATPPQLVGHWSEPIASSSAAYDSDHNTSEGNEETRHRGKNRRQYKKPTYRFHLDPLDSFETWILTLTLQRKSDSIASLRGMSRPLRWEKPVAAGLDRVFRDWFHSSTDEISRSLGGGDSSFYRASLIASATSSTPYSLPSISSYSATMDKSSERQEEEDQPQPEPKILEFDGTSCTMTIQPHAVASSSSLLHPALTLMPSHHYLSNAGLSSHSFSSRVEFNFHCESLTINAARLLNVLEDVERDAEKASDLARKRGAHIVAGSSGSTTWAYSTGGSRYVNDGSSTPWTGTRGESGVSVLVFGAVRD